MQGSLFGYVSKSINVSRSEMVVMFSTILLCYIIFNIIHLINHSTASLLLYIYGPIFKVFFHKEPPTYPASSFLHTYSDPPASEMAPLLTQLASVLL